MDKEKAARNSRIFEELAGIFEDRRMAVERVADFRVAVPDYDLRHRPLDEPQVGQVERARDAEVLARVCDGAAPGAVDRQDDDRHAVDDRDAA